MNQSWLWCNRIRATNSGNNVFWKISLTDWLKISHQMMCCSGNAYQLCSDWNRTLCSGTENHGHHRTHLTSCVGHGHLSPVTWPLQNGFLTRGSPSSHRLLPLLVYGELLAFDVVLYKNNTSTSHNYRMSADSSFSCLITLINSFFLMFFFLELIYGYLEKKTL